MRKSTLTIGVVAIILCVIASLVILKLTSPSVENPRLILPHSSFTYLLDTDAAHQETYTEKELTQKSGWQIVPEDHLPHHFRGDTVLLNDKLIVVLRRAAGRAEVYTRRGDKLKKRALLIAKDEKNQPAKSIAAVKILENNPGVVMLETTFQTESHRQLTARLRLTTGQNYLEIVPGQGMKNLLYRADCRHVVVPDFFGDDLVYRAESLPAGTLPLPAENFFLHLVNRGGAIIMCVWPSNQQSAQVMVSRQGRENVIEGSQLTCQKDTPIWVAFLEGSQLWYERSISRQESKQEIILDWKPPFPARWRVDFLSDNEELAYSLPCREIRQQQNPPLGLVETQPACWFDRERSVMQFPELPTNASTNSPRSKFPASVIIYPIDRSLTTPLTVFCPIDIMRNTLGVGPCRYILEKEGLGAELHPTPDQVTRWVEKQFCKKKARQLSPEIKEQLKQMIEHMQRTRDRIRQYQNFIGQVQKLLHEEMSESAAKDDFRKLERIVNGMIRNLEISSNAVSASATAEPLAEQIIALIGKADALAGIQIPAGQIRVLGAAQDKLLSQCRMAVRRIKHQCRIIAVESRQKNNCIDKVLELASQMLQKNQ